ncbi:MAG: DUF4351 domain-containing protein [Planctomycetota bacterium]|nr:DUF4351 domain-containing protein [Planctomycetota bacterium]
MKESVTYQAILEEGRVQGVVVGREEGRQEGRQQGREEGRADEARRILLSLGTKRFGKPPVKVRRRIALLAESAVLEGLATRLLDVESWADLLADL